MSEAFWKKERGKEEREGGRGSKRERGRKRKRERECVWEREREKEKKEYGLKPDRKFLWINWSQSYQTFFFKKSEIFLQLS
jgi:hypothetical protein